MAKKTGEETKAGKIIWDADKKIHYCKEGYVDHLIEELTTVAGILDMLFLINEADMWSQRSHELGMAILDTRKRVQVLADEI